MRLRGEEVSTVVWLLVFLQLFYSCEHRYTIVFARHSYRLTMECMTIAQCMWKGDLEKVVEEKTMNILQELEA